MKHKESFSELLRSSQKSSDTEEWLDVHFTRKVGLAVALLSKRVGLSPNTITVISIFLGVMAAAMFYHTDIRHNIAGVALLMMANFCDSADGQLARLTHKESLIGRILDGMAGNVWFIAIYIALCLRLTVAEGAPFSGWMAVLPWALAAVSGLVCHSPQASLADYYRQIHLWMLKGGNVKVLHMPVAEDKNEAQEWYVRFFGKTYSSYTASQQRRTPAFQRYYEFILLRYSSLSSMSEKERNAFLNGSRPLMKWTNILTFNTRAIVLYAACLSDCVPIYFLFEICVLHPLYFYMHSKHENLSKAHYALYSSSTK